MSTHTPSEVTDSIVRDRRQRKAARIARALLDHIACETDVDLDTAVDRVKRLRIAHRDLYAEIAGVHRPSGADWDVVVAEFRVQWIRRQTFRAVPADDPDDPFDGLD